MMFKCKVDVGKGKPQTLVVINHKDEEETMSTRTVTVNQLHHIHILDRSGSMRSEINNLIDNVQKTFEVIGDDDLISILWFSGPGDYRTLVKGAKKSGNLSKLLDTIRSVLGTTCFSDPLRETNTIIEELVSLCPNISVNLFTDGQPVVPWTVTEEERRIFEELNKMKANVLAFNTIGYGPYYNRDLLIGMSSISEFGIFCHSRRIEDYLDIFKGNYEKVCEVATEGIYVGTSTDQDIIYLNRNFTKMELGELVLNRSDSRKNQIFIIGPNEFEFDYQNETFNSKDIKTKPTDKTIDNFLYAYAWNLFYKGNRQQCLDILAKVLYDKYLVDSQMGSFTYDECGAFSDALKRAIFSPKERYVDGKCSSKYIPDNNAPCVMDILSILQQKECYYIPLSKNVDKYERITRKTDDNFDLFTATKDEVRAPISDFVYNKEHINLSIRYTIPGKVKINKKEADKVGLPTEIDSFIYRNHTIIKDGMLNMKKIEVLIPSEMLTKELRKFISIIENIDGDGTYERCILHLSHLPIINRLYINRASTIDEVFETTKRINYLEAKNKVVKFLLDQTIEEGSATLKKQGGFTDYNAAQIEVLQNHGINKDMSYGGVDKSKPKAEASDSYETRTMEFYISGFSSLPKVSEVLDAIQKKEPIKKKGLVLLKEAYDEVTGDITNVYNADLSKKNVALRNALQNEQMLTKRELTSHRATLSTLKMAKILTGDWFPGLQDNGKGEYVYTKDDVTMVAKVARTTEYL